MTTLRQHADHLLGASAILVAAEASLVTAVAEVVRASVNRQINQDVPRRRVAGASVGVRTRHLLGSSVEVFATGPLHLENNPTKPHSIAPKGPHPLAFQVGGRTVYVNRVQHPGTKGKRTWQQGVDHADPFIHQQFEVEARALIRSLW